MDESKLYEERYVSQQIIIVFQIYLNHNSYMKNGKGLIIFVAMEDIFLDLKHFVQYY